MKRARYLRHRSICAIILPVPTICPFATVAHPRTSVMKHLLFLYSLMLAVIVVLLTKHIEPVQASPTVTPTLTPHPCTIDGPRYNDDVAFTLVPAPPEQMGTIVEVSGVSSDWCGPRYRRYERLENKIAIYAYEPSYLASCGELALGWGFDVNVGELEPGKYTVQLILECEAGAFPCSDVTTVWVNATPPPAPTPTPDHTVYLPQLRKAD